MHRMKIIRLFAVLCLLVLAAPATALAAESYDNCKGFIDAVPTTISSQGVWCLRSDLSTNLASGAAITITVNNVTIACNDFKLGNLAAGEGNGADGILANNKLNTTVRGCNVRGYFIGIELIGSGHVVEDNRIEGSGYEGIAVYGDGSVVRRNRVLDTGNSAYSPYAAIYSSGTTDILDNIVTNVTTVVGSGAGVIGIFLGNNQGGRVQGNAVRGLLGESTPYGIFINNDSGGLSVSDNQLSNAGAVDGNGIQCAGALASILSGNHVFGFTGVSAGCIDGGGNVGN